MVPFHSPPNLVPLNEKIAFRLMLISESIRHSKDYVINHFCVRTEAKNA